MPTATALWLAMMKGNRQRVTPLALLSSIVPPVVGKTTQIATRAWSSGNAYSNAITISRPRKSLPLATPLAGARKSEVSPAPRMPKAAKGHLFPTLQGMGQETGRAPPRISRDGWEATDQVFLTQYGLCSSGHAASTARCVYVGVPEEAAPLQRQAECHAAITVKYNNQHETV